MTAYAADPELVTLLTDIFGDWQEASGSASLQVELDRGLWSTLERAGLTSLTSEDSGAGWAEAAALISIGAAHAAPVPLAENDLLAGWLLDRAGLDRGTAIRTACLLDDAGRAAAVPWADGADRIAVVYRRDGNTWVADVAAEDVTVERGRDIAGIPWANVRVETTRTDAVQVDEAVASLFDLRRRIARCVQISAVLQQAVRLSIRHAQERVQFGRPLAGFQAIQQLVADQAAEAAIAQAAADLAVAAVLAQPEEVDRLVGSVDIALSVVAHAVPVVVRAAHQVHGAIGTTAEHWLHSFTLPALAWLSELRSLRDVDLAIAGRAAGDAAGFWAWATR